MENLTTGNNELDEKITEWSKWDKNEKTRAEIKKLVQDGKIETLRNLMLNRLAFGTAGLRGVMGAGYAAMNDLVIIQTSQGLAKYIQTVIPEAVEKGVVISFDGRHNSHRFARLAAASFLQLGIPVYLFSNITPTPFVPFTIVQYKCVAGIMVTASHNPKEDNGYKVYWNNGAQIISPHDKGIHNSILGNLQPWSKAWDISLTNNNPLCKDPLEDITNRYFKIMEENIYDKNLNSECPIVFTFTAMHGVSHPFMVQAFETCAFKHYIPVKEQMNPDPDFPTVKFPNPEEGKSALDLSFMTANNANSRVILANDPDADRLAVAEKQPTEEWKVFSGNETGALLGWWLWHCFKEKHPKVPASDVYMISSTVSSKILKSISKIEGFNFIETLTGFKWMGNKSDELLKQGKTVLLAFEEAIGYMCGTAVLDKDGINAAMILAQLAAYLQNQGKTLTEQLFDIYKRYGCHVSNNSYYICHSQPIIQKMFHRLRNYSGPNSYPAKFGSFAVKDVRDLTTGYDSTQPDKKAILPVSASSQMITFYLENGCVITIRTSGTEPKVKYYSEFVSEPNLPADYIDVMTRELDNIVRSMVEECYEPEKNGLIPKSD